MNKRRSRLAIGHDPRLPAHLLQEDGRGPRLPPDRLGEGREWVVIQTCESPEARTISFASGSIRSGWTLRHGVPPADCSLMVAMARALSVSGDRRRRRSSRGWSPPRRPSAPCHGS